MLKICAQNFVSSWWGNNPLYMKLKLESDATEEYNIENAVKTHDINPVTMKINTIIRKAKKIIKKQVSETEKEDQSYNLQSQYSKTFISFTIVQILIVLLIGVYHIYSFRNFLIANQVIKDN
jgi:hypothetical protein